MVLGWGTWDCGEITKHKDKEDIISAIITLDDESIVGGDTIYFNDLIGNKSSNITYTTYLQHGQGIPIIERFVVESL